MATIKDVAKLAGVSIATVSNVLNGKVSAESEKYRLVQEAVRELNYRPNYNAQNLKKGKTRLIGVLLPQLESPYQDIYFGLCKIFESKQYYPILKLTGDDCLLEQDMLRSYLDMGVSGIITVPARTQTSSVYQEIEKRGIPLVVVERRLEGMDCNYVVFDNATLIRHQIQEFRGRWDPAEIFLLHRKGYYTSDEDCRRGFLQSGQGREENIIAVSSECDESFKKVYEQFVFRGSRIKCILAATLGLARVAYEVAEMLNREVQIYALADNGWNVHNVYKNIHTIKRDMIMAGMKAGQMIVEQEEHRGDIQTFYLKRKPQEQRSEVYVSGVKKELKVLALDSEATEVLEKLSAAADAKSNLHVTYDKKSYSELKEALDKEMESPVCSYDIVMIDKPWLPYYTSQEFLYEMRKELGQDMLKQYPEVIRKSFFPYDKRRCVLPMISSIQAIYYRKDWFEDVETKAAFQGHYGVPLALPRSWKEYNMICEFFTRECNPDSPFAYGTTINTSDKNSLISEFYPRQWAFNGTVVDRWGDVVLSQDGNVRALNNLRETYRFCEREIKYETKDDEMFSAILHGEAAMVMGYASHYSPQKYKEQTCAHLLGVTQVPRGKSILGGYCMGINNKSPNIKESCEYLRWMISDEMSIANMRMNGCIPTYAVYNHTGLRLKYPWMDLVNQSFANGGSRDKVIAADGKQILPEAVDNVLGEMLLEALKSKRDTEELLLEAEEKVLKMIENSIETF